MRTTAPSAAAVARLRTGGIVVVTPDAGRCEAPNMVLPAEAVSADAVAFLARRAGGLVRLALHACDCARLGLRRQPASLPPREREGEELLVSIEAASGVATGISAADRATTLRVAGSPSATAAAILSPGHVVPVRAAPGGVLARPGVAEAALALCRRAGWAGGAVLCHLLDRRGDAASPLHARAVAHRHGLPVVGVGDIVADLLAAELEWLPVPA